MPSKKPKQKRSKVTVDSILEASRIIIKKTGLEKFNTNNIADVAGVSIGSLYQYFKNKESILEVLLHKELEKSRVALNEMINQDSDLGIDEIVEIVVFHLVEKWEEKGVFGKILFQIAPKYIDLSLFKTVDDILIPHMKKRILESNLDISIDDLEYALFLIIQNVRTTVFLINSHYQEYDSHIIKKELSIMISSYLKARS